MEVFLVRTYSEIGCLTLLGVTLTVYVVAGNCQSGEDPYDSQNNIRTGFVDNSVILSGIGKHYYVTFSSPTEIPVKYFPVSVASFSEIRAFSIIPLDTCPAFFPFSGVTHDSISDIPTYIFFFPL
jgi:hypothetical protein